MSCGAVRPTARRIAGATCARSRTRWQPAAATRPGCAWSSRSRATGRALMSAGERVELGRYTISAGERVLYGQRVLGVVRVVDVPAGGRGRRYIVERGLTSMSELDAIVADYLQQAAVWDACLAAAARCWHGGGS